MRNYRDYKATDFGLAFAQWIHGINRGVLLPPGLDEQWLVSVMHTEGDAMRYADVFAECALDRRDAVAASPERARSLLTVRAAISSALSSDRPCFRNPSLMCSY